MLRKRDGFKNQLTIVLPAHIQKELKNNPLTKLLFISDIGYYPDAKNHYRERNNGCEQNILIFCTDGCGYVEVAGMTKKISKNSFFIIQAGVPHKYYANENCPWSIYWLHFSGTQSMQFASSGLTVSELQAVNRNDIRTQVFEEIYHTLSMGYSKENLEYTSVCLWYLLGSFHFYPQFECIKIIQQNDIIEKSILYMQENICSNISLKQIASYCGYSASHFSMIFKKKTTRSPIEYFLYLKMQRACQMLDFSSKRVKEISAELAFNDPFYFSRLFKQIIGVSPNGYRKKIKG